MENNNSSNSGLKSIRTLQTDIQDLSKGGVSASDLAAEAEKRENLAEKTFHREFSAGKIIAVLAVFVVITGIGASIFWFFGKKQEQKQPVFVGPKPILVSDRQIEAGFDLSSIQSALKTVTQINGFLYISISASPADFLKIINANPPQGFIGSLGARFMLAKFYFTKDWPILIFNIESYEQAFAGMLKWEGTMSRDLSAIFESADAGDFSDKEIQNHDTRVVYGMDGSPVLIYSFINRDYLVIVQNEEPLKEVFRRFSSSQYLNE